MNPLSAALVVLKACRCVLSVLSAYAKVTIIWNTNKRKNKKLS